MSMNPFDQTILKLLDELERNDLDAHLEQESRTWLEMLHGILSRASDRIGEVLERREEG